MNPSPEALAAFASRKFETDADLVAFVRANAASIIIVSIHLLSNWSGECVLFYALP